MRTAITTATSFSHEQAVVSIALEGGIDSLDVDAILADSWAVRTLGEDFDCSDMTDDMIDAIVDGIDETVWRDNF